MILCQFQQFLGIWSVILQKASPGETAVEGHPAQKLVTMRINDLVCPGHDKICLYTGWEPVAGSMEMGLACSISWASDCVSSKPRVSTFSWGQGGHRCLVSAFPKWELKGVNFIFGRCPVRFTGMQEETCLFFFFNLMVIKCLWSMKNAYNVSWLLALVNTYRSWGLMLQWFSLRGIWWKSVL